MTTFSYKITFKTTFHDTTTVVYL